MTYECLEWIQTTGKESSRRSFYIRVLVVVTLTNKYINTLVDLLPCHSFICRLHTLYANFGVVEQNSISARTTSTRI